MPRNPAIDRILSAIEIIWSEPGAWPELVSAMRQALPLNAEQAGGAERTGRLSMWDLACLPGVCCQAAGGRAEQADTFAAAWLLFYLAANLMDHVQDGDPPDAWWAELGAPVALNTASGLYFSALRLLQNGQTAGAADAAAEAAEAAAAAAAGAQDAAGVRLVQALLAMAGAQHADLSGAVPNLELYTKIAEAKTGAFFRAAAWGGAWLSGFLVGVAQGDGAARLQGFADFGLHLGCLLQVLDDLADFKNFGSSGARLSVHSLPAAYACSVLPPAERQRLLDCLRQAHVDAGMAREAYERIDQCGAGMYLWLEVERRRGLAHQALRQAAPQAPAGEALLAYLQALG